MNKTNIDFVEVAIVKDDSGITYTIPINLKDKFYELENLVIQHEFDDNKKHELEFKNTFSKYTKTPSLFCRGKDLLQDENDNLLFCDKCMKWVDVDKCKCGNKDLKFDNTF